jgi:hypothetical protein
MTQEYLTDGEIDQRWLDRLNPRFRQIAMARLSEMEVSLETAAGG